MPYLPYLQELTIRLATGAAKLPEESREEHARFVLSGQQADGGFAGRQGDSDLYYTGFALRSLSMLGQLYGEPAERAAAFLESRLHGQETIVDFLSLIYGGSLLEMSAGIDIYQRAAPTWRRAVAEALEQLRRDDGGYAKGPQGHASSTYHTFLVVLCLQLLERPIPQPQRIVEFVHSQECPEGGFLEIRAGKRAGTNPTAAAIGVLRALDALDPQRRGRTVDFLAEMQTDDGGLRANTRIPFADLLSTFTGLLTLGDLQALDEVDLDDAARFVLRMQAVGGGFHGAELDDARDMEYTFYGLGAWSLLV